MRVTEIFYVLAAFNMTSLSASLELLANYKYWKSASTQLSYDYSGNSRHGSLLSNYILTDRGLVPNMFYYPSLMSYAFLSNNEYTFSYWMHNQAQASDVWFIVYHDFGNFEVRYDFANAYTSTHFRINGGSGLKTLNTSSIILGWNLHTVRILVRQPNAGIIDVELYLNLVIIRSDFIDTGAAYIKITFIHMGNRDSNRVMTLYEMWIHRGFSSISELNYLLSGSTTCGCLYNCPTTPSTICLPSYDKSKNIQGNTCPSTCTDISLSCDSGLNCILRSKSGCKYGLYDIQSSNCIFNCPYNSCTLPLLITDAFITYSLFSFTCNTGFNKISDNPPGCMSIRCLSYNIEGYKYICDIIESGYTLDTLGDCCICKSGFTQASSNPIVCVNTSICIGHTVVSGDYSCSSCATGYTIDSDSKCNKCDSNYVNVLANPYTCILKIENCNDYIFDGIGWRCQECSEGYAIDSQGKCNKCSPGYLNVLANPYTCILNIENCNDHSYINAALKCNACTEGYAIDSEGKCNKCTSGYVNVLTYPYTCILKIENCNDHNYIHTSLKCNACSEGYAIDSEGKCNQCNSGYANILTYPYTCILKIENCNDQSYIDAALKCSTCSEGYVIDSEGKCNQCSPGYEGVLSYPLVCVNMIEHCKEYIDVGNRWICDSCSEGYAIDTDGKCNQCSDNYVNVLSDPFTCAVKIDHCEGYKYLDNTWKCDVCENGYKKGRLGSCDECDIRYGKIESESLLCEPNISNCLEYDLTQESLRCKKCNMEYSIDHNFECTQCSQGYVNLPQDSSICIREISKCLEYGLFESKLICITCEVGYEIDDDLECKKCSKDYIYSSNSEVECIPKPDNSNSNSNSSKTEEEEDLSEIQLNRGETIALSNAISTNAASASTGVGSILSMDISTLILYMNTIQLISLIQYLNINLPFEIRKQQTSTNKFIKQANIMSYIKIEDRDLNQTIVSFMNDETSFLGNSIYQAIILGAILILNISFYIIVKYGRGKLQGYVNKALQFIKYTIYIQLYMITYLDLSYNSISKLVQVIFI
jgi:hypothetical protein